MDNTFVPDEINDFFIYTEKNSISKELCKTIIDKFDNDNRKSEGQTVRGTSSSKKSMDIMISRHADWSEIDSVLFNTIHKSLVNYFTKFYNTSDEHLKKYYESIFNVERQDFGYQLQYYEKNTGYYKWHDDSLQSLFLLNQSRLLTFIWYLNDVEVGGETEFLNSFIKPVAGKLLIFPATWTYIHRGKMPISNSKYIITGWIGSKIVEDDIFNQIKRYKENKSLNIETP